MHLLNGIWNDKIALVGNGILWYTNINRWWRVVVGSRNDPYYLGFCCLVGPKEYYQCINTWKLYILEKKIDVDFTWYVNIENIYS